MRRILHSGKYHKLTALLIATVYFILLIFINNSSYVWATLAFVFVLFVTTFTCAKTDSPLLIQLRAARLAELNTSDPNEVGRGGEEQETRIWMTDVPPSYALVMELGPPTPPPSYGSAILMFPPPYSSGKSTPQPEGRRRPPLSISTQVSVCNSLPGTPQPRETRFTFSTQISLVEAGRAREEDVFADTLQLRTRLFLSRQASREDVASEEEPRPAADQRNEETESGSQLPLFLTANEDGKDSNFSTPLQLRARLYLSRQASREDIPGSENSGTTTQQEADDTRSNCQTPIFLQDGPFSEPLQLRTKLYLSRQASREDTVDGQQSRTLEARTKNIPFVLAFKKEGNVDEEVRTGCNIPVVFSTEEYSDGEEIHTTCEIPVILLNEATLGVAPNDPSSEKQEGESNCKKRK